MEKYPYQATIVGSENIPPARQDKWRFLETIAQDLHINQAIRLILPLNFKSSHLDNGWRKVCKRMRVIPHSRIDKNGENKAMYLWFEGQ